MATIRIPRLIGKTNQAGLTSWYWQPSATLAKRGWASQPLGTGGSLKAVPDDVAAAARALNVKVDGADALAPAALRRVQRPVTLAEGVARFRTAGFPSVRRPGFALAPATVAEYEKKFRVLLKWGGDVALTSITDQRVARLRDALMTPVNGGRSRGADQSPVRHHNAHGTLRVGRALFHWFEQQHLIARGGNPFARFALATPDPRQTIWSAPAREAILAAARTAADPDMELAIDLAFSIGQREADLLKLQLSQYVEVPLYKMDGDVHATLGQVAVPAFAGRPGYVPGDVRGIRIRQGKGKRWVEVPVVGATRARIEAAHAAALEAGVTCLLFDRDRGLPWTMPNLQAGAKRFNRRFLELRGAAIAASIAASDVDLAAELGELQFRDYRRTAVVFLGELAIPSHLIAAITGHVLDVTEKILETYLPRTTGMAARAIALSQARGGEAKKQEQVK